MKLLTRHRLKKKIHAQTAEIEKMKQELIIAHLSDKGYNHPAKHSIHNWASPFNDCAELPEGICFFDDNRKLESPDSMDDYIIVVADSFDVLNKFVTEHNFTGFAFHKGEVTYLNNEIQK